MANFNEAAIIALRDKVVSLPMTLGIFAQVNQHEPKSAPRNAPFLAIYVESMAALPQASGLNSVSGVITFTLRPYLNMLQEPQDDIDRQLLVATCALWGAYAGAFTLGGTARNVDLFRMSARAGYIDQDTKKYRVMETSLPVVISDMFTEVA